MVGVVDRRPIPPGFDSPAQPAKSTLDEHYRLVIILFKVKVSLIPAKNPGGGRGAEAGLLGGKLLFGTAGPAQQAKSTRDEHNRLLKTKMYFIPAKNMGGSLGITPLVPRVLDNQLRAHGMSIIDERS